MKQISYWIKVDSNYKSRISLTQSQSSGHDVITPWRVKIGLKHTQQLFLHSSRQKQQDCVNTDEYNQNWLFVITHEWQTTQWLSGKLSLESFISEFRWPKPGLYYAACPSASWDLEFTRVRPSQLPCKVVVRGQSVVCPAQDLSSPGGRLWAGEHPAGSVGHVASCDMPNRLVTRANSAKHSQATVGRKITSHCLSVCLSVWLSVCGEDRVVYT